MRIGVPKEIKNHEYRVGLTPGFGRRAGRMPAMKCWSRPAPAWASISPTRPIPQVGAKIAPDAAAVFAGSDMIVKVKEPQPQEIALLEPRHILFTYLHLAADKPQAEGLMESGATCIAYETVTSHSGALPLLKPMSEVAGPHVGPGRRALSREGTRRPRRTARRRSRRGARARSRSSAAASRASTPRRWPPACAPT